MTFPIEINSNTNEFSANGLPVKFEEANLLALYQLVENEVKHEVPDVETQEGRARIKSLAAKVSSSKTAIDKPIRDYLREIKSLPKIIEKNARESVERFDALRDATLAPLNAAQEKQDRIIEKLVSIVPKCQEAGVTSELVARMLEYATDVNLDDFWPELTKKAKAAKEAAISVATDYLERIRKEEAQAAELERLRKEAELREQQDRERKIAEAAAEKARLEAEQKARQEREDIERRAVEAKQREENQRMAAEKARREAEEAEKRRLEAEERAKLAAIEAEKNAKIEAEKAAQKAVEDALEQAETERKEAERLAKEWEANKEHRIKINRAAMVAMMANGVDEANAKAAITAIAKGLVPNIKIMY